MVSRDFTELFECLSRHEVKAVVVDQPLEDCGFGNVGLSVENFTLKLSRVGTQKTDFGEDDHGPQLRVILEVGQR